MEEGDVFTVFAPITELEIVEKASGQGKKPSQEIIVKGYMTTDTVDAHGDIIDEEASFKAADEWMKMGNIREMHQPSAVGVAIHMDKHKGKGVFLESNIVDPVAVTKVRKGVYKGYSIGGKIKKIEVSAEGGPNRITEYSINEVSLVDVPANPDCLFLAKRADFISKNEEVNKMAEPDKKTDEDTTTKAEVDTGAESDGTSKDEAASKAAESQNETSTGESTEEGDEAQKLAVENASLKKEILKLKETQAKMEKERTMEDELVKILTRLEPDLKKRMSEKSTKKIDPKMAISKMTIGEVTSLMLKRSDAKTEE